jgi:hypothetical protein
MKTFTARRLTTLASCAALAPFASCASFASFASFAAVLAGATASCSSTTTPNSGGGGTIQVTASGEALALDGYAFPPASKDDVAFVDGWEIRFHEVLVTVDKITLSENPDRSPTDQAQTEGVVATADGPWAVDLHRGGPLAGKGGSGEQAVFLTDIVSQNKNGNQGFDATKRYAFGYDVVPAAANAKRIAFEGASADYDEMIAKGLTVLYVGTATFKGTACNPATDPVLDALPKVVDFRIGFKAPTSYLNCQNPDNDPASPFAAEEHQRGIIVKANTKTIAQVTFHTEHPFWESFEHDSPPHFDQIAALATPGAAGGAATVAIDDLAGVDPTAFKTKSGQPLPWRSCVPADVYPLPSTSPMGFDTKGVPVNPGGSAETSIRDYRDYLTYNESTEGHLNADGLCFVKRNYPSPP